MFDQVPVAVERLALCLETQRRFGASHALLHLRRIAAFCLRATVVDDSRFGTEIRHTAMALAQPLKDLDDALAADRLDRAAISMAREQLTSIRLQLARLQAVIVNSPLSSE
jgi:hypothetical protein